MAETLPFDLSPADVARLTSTSANTVKKWAKEGHLAGIRLPNGYWRFRRVDVDAFIESIRTQPDSVEASA